MIRSDLSAQNPGRGRGGRRSVDLVRDLLRKAQEEAAIGVLQRGEKHERVCA
jgi:3'-phosphoadenosine 5'-phosphosulfate sulfotransferase